MSVACPVCAAVDLAIEARGVEVLLGDRQVLRGVDLIVPRGEVVALIGPNGAGKTTLLRSLIGLVPRTAGRIRLLGEDDLDRALPRIGYVPQRLVVERNFILSAREFLAIRLRRTRGWFWQSHKSIDACFGEELERLGVSSLLDLPLAALSGGQLQRVLIAFSLLGRPELLLLDEPTNGVDQPGEKTFYELIGEVHRRHRLTVVLVSHDLSMVYRQATWVYALNGVVCCQGPVDEVMNTDSLKLAYGTHVSPYHHQHVH
ncbi:MAG TPA: metal ABC transporter ATP-binding protein [Candidatus Paceibacterota bacterium]|nr:metal ABC transporter ATP-binding protein [Verrucomicrobiota bacterium]HRY48050.1 metal ABC transporter ATP-binding protein [Candidatus Paceibacterota bacterium]